MPYYPPDRIGGVGEFAAALHEGLLARGVDSIVVTRGKGGPARGVRRIARSRLGWFLGMLAWTRRAAGCDIVHCQSGEALPLLLALRCWPGRRARVLATYHVDNRRMAEAELPYSVAGKRFGRRPGIRGRLSRALHRMVDAAGIALADAINTVSRATALDLLGPVRGGGVHVIHNGVPAASVPDEGESVDENGWIEPVDLFYAGLATHRKRVLALPFVLAAVRRARPEARLRIAGFDADAAPGFYAECERLGVADAVDLLGPLPATALPAHYRAARVALVPSAYEGLPYAILEAMREGTPVVATWAGGHAEVIEDGDNGLLVAPDDPAAMAARCLQILEDPALAERLSRAGRETVARDFSLDAQIDAYLDYYRSLSKGKV